MTNIREILGGVTNEYSECSDENSVEVNKQIHNGGYFNSFYFHKNAVYYSIYSITGTEDCFGTQLSNDDLTLRALRQGPHPDGLSSDIKAYSTAFIKLLKRQLDRYLTGPLSAPTPELLEKTQYADPSNMESERTLGMVDSLMRQAPNAQVDLIGAKVKNVKNDTVPWLCSMPHGEQRQIMRSAARQRRTVAKKRKQRKARNLEIAKQRLYELELKKQKKKTRQMENKVTRFVKQGIQTTPQDVKNAFPEASQEVVQLTVQICRDPESIIGKDLTHLWYDKVKCENEVYIGNVFEYKGGKKKVIVMEYWLPDCPEDSHKSELFSTEVLADLLLGDLLFH